MLYSLRGCSFAMLRGISRSCVHAPWSKLVIFVAMEWDIYICIANYKYNQQLVYFPNRGDDHPPIQSFRLGVPLHGGRTVCFVHGTYNDWLWWVDFHFSSTLNHVKSSWTNTIIVSGALWRSLVIKHRNGQSVIVQMIVPCRCQFIGDFPAMCDDTWE